jgi:hypothetical protein
MKLFFILFFTYAALLAQPGMANLKTQEEKIYVDLKDLIFDSSGIWFNIPTDAVQKGATALHFDQDSGYYIAYSEQSWRCPKCNLTNLQGTSICRRCGWPDK